MDLLNNIRSDRAQRKKKRPFKPTLFARVSGLVKKYGLREDFLAKLETPENFFSEGDKEVARIRKKQTVDFPLFSLSSEEHYRLAMEIIHKANSPYLEHAHAPEEIALSRPLYELNPSIEAQRLNRYHFETLMLHERGKRELKDLEKKVTAERQKSGADSGSEAQQREPSTLNSLAERMEVLQTFIRRTGEFEVE